MAIVKIPFRSRVMGFLIIARCFCSHGKGDLQLATVVLEIHHEQTISGEEMHTLITFMVSVMASKCIESDSYSASYTSFMLNTINAMIFKLILPYDYWPGS